MRPRITAVLPHQTQLVKRAPVISQRPEVFDLDVPTRRVAKAIRRRRDGVPLPELGRARIDGSAFAHDSMAMRLKLRNPAVTEGLNR